MGITQHISGTDNVKSCANLPCSAAMSVSRRRCQSAARAEQRSGRLRHGRLAQCFPAYQQVANEDIRKKFEAAWNAKLSPKPGLTIMEMMEAAGRGTIKAIYIMGENPMLSDPDLQHVKKNFKNWI